ncbi:hypothetical protein GLW30_13595 [Halorubrum terrestre]|nr:7TM diverse intracellular signaling domain-containing protein [Halorubrum terrestre]MYL18130.1 hypothetical protein [Halorubrum terrestre]MYL68759.1 hypothetical protein [Halorubrum terrestre]
MNLIRPSVIIIFEFIGKAVIIAGFTMSDMAGIGPFSVLELVGLTVSLLGLFPVLRQHRPDTKWFTVGYLLLVAGMVATNLEAVVLPMVLNFTEHVVGIGLAGLVFLFAAYDRRSEVAQDTEGVSIND